MRAGRLLTFGTPTPQRARSLGAIRVTATVIAHLRGRRSPAGRCGSLVAMLVSKAGSRPGRNSGSTWNRRLDD
jgi:hypothetical protein